MSQADRHIAQIDFVDGVRRYVFRTPDGRQYVLNAAGKRVYGVWHLPADKYDEPAVIETQPAGVRDSVPRHRPA